MSPNQMRDIKGQIDHNLLFMGYKERGGHILQQGFGYHITQECSVLEIEKTKQKTQHIKSCNLLNLMWN